MPQVDHSTTDISPFISWPGIVAIMIATLSSVFIGWIIWRKKEENPPPSAFWCFTILVGFIFAVPLIPELINQMQHVKAKYGAGEFAFERTESTNDNARRDLSDALKALIARITPAESITPAWVLYGEGGNDCPGEDIGATPGPIPSTKMCNDASSGTTAVCWDGTIYTNRSSPVESAAWCTYKRIGPERCKGGGSPGRVYMCLSKLAKR
jgi:hypothetical protein